MHRILTKSNKKGFTLIELLVVIAIIAILFVVVLLTLNPAELLRQARDSNRVSDMGTMKSAISLYLADVTTPSLGTYGVLYLNSGATAATTPYIYVAGTPTTWGYKAGAVASTLVGTSTTQRNVDDTGWIPVNFSGISSGSPIGNLPVDPLSTASNTYAYAASSTSFKLSTKMESSKFSYGGTGDVVSTDGGNSTTTYEGGTLLTM